MKIAILVMGLTLVATSAGAQNTPPSGIRPSADNNCTTQPAAHTQTNTASNGIVGSTANNTITVNLDGPFTSSTGYLSIFPASGGSSWGAPGNAGSYKILSGNGTASIVLDGSSTIPPGGTPSRTNGGTTVNGSAAGRYVSDLAVIRNSARSYTFHWTTPGFNSDTWVSYSDDPDTIALGGSVGYIWRSADTVTGVQDHTITIDNLDLSSSYTFTVWNNCFTNGEPDVNLSIHQPQGIMAANQTAVTVGQTKIVTTAADYTGQPLNVFTVAGYNDSPSSTIYVPWQDGTHQGWRVAPGGQINLQLDYINSTLPAQGATGDNRVSYTVDDWMPGGMLDTYGRSGTAYGITTGAWNDSSQAINIGTTGGSLAIYVPSTVPTSAPCGGVAGAEAIMVDGGTVPACAYPLKITGYRWWNDANYTCGSTATCGPPGTTAQTPNVNVPIVVKTWAVIFNANGLVPKGTVGPWINPFTSQPGIPCESNATKTVDKTNAAYSQTGCFNFLRGAVGFANNMYTYQGSVPDSSGTPAPAGQPYAGQQANCVINGKRSENSYAANSQPTWFYDAGYVCHALDVQFPRVGQNNDEYEKFILGLYWEQASYARANDATMFASYHITGNYSVNPDPVCTAITGNVDFYCTTITIPVSGDVSAIQTGLAAGQRFRACLNGTNTTFNPPRTNSYACYVFPGPNTVPVQQAAPEPGGNLPASPATTNVSIQLTDINGMLRTSPPSSVAVTVDSTCPASGNCSIKVPSPAARTNAYGYNVYARNGPTGNFYIQNTSGPIAIGTDFVFGTSTNPLQTSGDVWAAVSWGLNIVSIIAADNVAHTLTINSNWSSDRPVLANDPSIVIMRQLTGIPADTGTAANKLVCNSCNFAGGIIGGNTGVPLSAVVYCGVTPGDMGAPLYTQAPQRGSTISSIPDAHTINLTTAINCAPGTNFEVRRRVAPPGGVRIFGWANTPYDVWKRFGNYIGADTVMWLAQNTTVTGAAVSHCCSFGAGIDKRRESALSYLSCHRAINVLHDLSVMGATTALAPQPNCTDPNGAITKRFPSNMFALIQTLTQNNYGHGGWMGSFLSGLVGYAIIDWWQDPLMGELNNPEFPYWTKRLTDAIWTYYSVRNSYFTPCRPSWPHEWGYTGLGEDNILGTCTQSNGNMNILQTDGSQPLVNDYWSVMGNILPMFAFFYQYTGNAVIPNVGGMVRWPWKPCYDYPSLAGVPGCGQLTYGQAYQDMASWIFVHAVSQPAWTGAGGKTLGEMGIWQDRAITWMQGSGEPPPPLTSMFTVFAPPIP